MDYEQRYKDALDEAKAIYKTIKQDLKPVIEQIFPELKESEDEQIRKEDEDVKKWLISQLEIKSDMHNSCELELMILKSIAWLEKQGKTNIQNNKPFKIESDKFYFCIKDYFAGGCHRSRKGDIVLAQNGMNMMGLSPKEASEYFIPINPFKEHVVVDWFEKEREKPQGKSALEARQETVDIAKKIKPKFKVGDWVVFNGLTLYINEVLKGYYRTISKGGTPNSYDWGIDYAARLWTIEDAKEGDVLSYETDEGDLWVMLYWSLYEPYEGHVHYHALLVNDNFTDKGTCCICIDDLKPATIEQHELLFRKMKEEGYQWDKNKKELIKL